MIYRPDYTILYYNIVEGLGGFVDRAVAAEPRIRIRHRLNGYLARRVPSLILAISLTMCLNCEVLKGMCPWKTKYPLG